MRRVKKTTNEQFDVLKAEMAVHPAAARGYGVGANRAIVDAEWKNIVEKLNAIGPPHRTMTEWKKVWSDLRLRNIKRLSEEFTPKPKKVKYKSKKNKLLETLNSADSIYASYDDETEQRTCVTTLNIPEESQPAAQEPYDNNPLEEGELNCATKPFYNPSLRSFVSEELYHHNSNNYNSECPSLRDTTAPPQFSEEKLNYLGQVLCTIEHQMKNQNKVMEHLSKITSNLAELMERHVTNLEKQNRIMEKQLRASEFHHVFLRRQEARERIRSKRKTFDIQKS